MANRMFARLPSALALVAALSLAACAGGGGQQPRAQATVSGETPPSTPQEAKTQCWMRYENKSAPRDLDKRMELVDKCIQEKMQQLPRAQ